MINILVRTSNRPGLFKRCIESIYYQTVDPTLINLIVSVDNPTASKYALKELEKYFFKKEVVQLTPDKTKGEFFYNLYNNDLTELVQEGWFFFLDDDDYLAEVDVLDKMLTFIASDPDRENPILCQFLRNGRPKPSNSLMDQKQVLQGHVGMPCLWVHHSMKDLVKFNASEFADFAWIKGYQDQIALRYVKQVVVASSPRGFGKEIN